MNISVLYFGMIAEWKGVSKETREIEPGLSSSDLLETIKKETPQLSGINYAVAFNQEMIGTPQALTEGCEVSIFPPFAGG